MMLSTKQFTLSKRSNSTKLYEGPQRRHAYDRMRTNIRDEISHNVDMQISKIIGPRQNDDARDVSRQNSEVIGVGFNGRSRMIPHERAVIYNLGKQYSKNIAPTRVARIEDKSNNSTSSTTDFTSTKSNMSSNLSHNANFARTPNMAAKTENLKHGRKNTKEFGASSYDNCHTVCITCQGSATNHSTLLNIVKEKFPTLYPNLVSIQFELTSVKDGDALSPNRWLLTFNDKQSCIEFEQSRIRIGGRFYDPRPYTDVISEDRPITGLRRSLKDLRAINDLLS